MAGTTDTNRKEITTMSTTSNATDATAALQFVILHATEDDLERMIQAVKDRRKALHQVRAASVQVGAEVTTANLSPKYLNGLTGQVEEITGQHCSIRLTADSTDDLRWARQTRFNISPEAKRFLLRGIPLAFVQVR